MSRVTRRKKKKKKKRKQSDTDPCMLELELDDPIISLLGVKRTLSHFKYDINLKFQLQAISNVDVIYLRETMQIKWLKYFLYTRLSNKLARTTRSFYKNTRYILH